MIKKSLLVLVLALLFFDVGFAQPDRRFCLGAGGYITGDFGGGIDASWWSLTHTTGEIISSEIISSETPYFGGGAFVFF